MKKVVDDQNDSVDQVDMFKKNMVHFVQLLSYTKREDLLKRSSRSKY